MSTALETIQTIRRSEKWRQRLYALLVHGLLVLSGIVVMFPMAWMLSTSLKSPPQVKSIPPIWIPNPLVWENYVNAVTIFPVSFWVFVP